MTWTIQSFKISQLLLILLLFWNNDAVKCRLSERLLVRIEGGLW